MDEAPGARAAALYARILDAWKRGDGPGAIFADHATGAYVRIVRGARMLGLAARTPGLGTES